MPYSARYKKGEVDIGNQWRINAARLNSSRNLNKRNDAGNNDKSAFRKAAESSFRVATGPKYKVPVEAATLAMELRRMADDHNKQAWLLIITLALAADGVTLIPIAGWILAWFIKPVLFIFLFGRGAGMFKWKTRLLRWALILLLIDFIPVIGDLLPLTTISVVYVWMKSSRKSKELSEVANNLEKDIKKNKKSTIRDMQESELLLAA